MSQESDSNKYPDLTQMCRLCLAENVASIPINPPTPPSHSISIPLRLMAVCGISVENGNRTDDLPKCLCAECRYQLERSYYFRKRSQVAQSKLRKHLRLLSIGKTSRIFVKDTPAADDDEYLDDESDFEDSLNFLRQEEETRVAQERQSLLLEVKKEVRTELQAECRRVELDELLDELATFLRQKRATLAPAAILKETSLERCGSPAASEGKPAKRRRQMSDTPLQPDKFEMESPLTEAAVASSDEAIDKDDDDDLGAEFYVLDAMENANDDDDQSQPSAAGNEDSQDEAVTFYSAATTDGFKVPGDASLAKAKAATGSPTSFQIENFSKIQLTHSMKVDDRSQSDENLMVFNIEQSAEMVELGMEPSVIVMNSSAAIRSPPATPTELGKLRRTRSGPPAAASSRCGATLIKHMPVKANNSNGSSCGTAEQQAAYLSTDTPKTFKCNACPMAYSSQLSLTRHLRGAHKKTAQKGVAYKCEDCHIHLSCKSALSRHMLIHSGQRPFRCEHCDRSFVQRVILQRHLRTHTHERPHKCTQCDRSFSQKVNLTQHINNQHTAVPTLRQHSCHLCPKQFSHASGLSRHLAYHSGVAFMCSACNRQFGDRSSVKRHIMRIHGGATGDEDNEDNGDDNGNDDDNGGKEQRQDIVGEQRQDNADEERQENADETQEK